MYATIEPRLIALLNDAPSESFPESPSLELPPLQDPNILKASGRPLLLEPDASKRNRKPGPASNTHPTCSADLIPSIDEDKPRRDTKQKPEKAPERALGGSSPQSLRKILGEDVTTSNASASKKRLIVENKDDFVQLPQPPKKQKAAKQVVPPIIIGLFEPPPQATLFPPIASSSFHDSHGRNTLNTIPLKVKEVEEVEEPSKEPPKNDSEATNTESKGPKKRKDVRPRKKWTEEETNNLLLGVQKHGLGNWAEILDDSSFSFNGRSGADLKDRFRTCCPPELRGKGPASINFKKSEGKYSKTIPPKSKSSLMSENILIDNSDLETSTTAGDATSSQDPKGPRKVRNHRRKVEDLAQLGIQGPFRKSQRRERRPFTEEEDREILLGYQIHGPAWTKIQRDPRFHLQSRQPTDLRDRFRNKYPEKFRTEDKGDTSGKENVVDANQSSTNFTSRDRLGKENSDPKHISTPPKVSPPSSQPSSQSGNRSGERTKEVSGKETTTLVTYPPSYPSFPSTHGLRIQEIISSEQEISKSAPLQSQTSLFGFKETFGAFLDAPVVDSTDGMPFSQSFDWGGSMTAPFPGNMGEMDINRLLLDESWIDNPGSSGKEKQNMTDLSSIVTSSTDAPSSQSYFTNLLCDPEQIVDLQESPFG
ncbi:hypothetical protein G7Y89_g8074 [Cudoniella acicularis]|uniref:Uncharacterized protein n=1 Tax=Cudoniella acicularis TaxID=354080 RepID=A0A8H4W1F6_9HELO|nr:hypothetical protein G7Y89_g8074 [Cudoniella acicularis]